LLESGRLRTVTRSVDGFSGTTVGTLQGVWVDEAGEKLGLDAEFTLRAVMPDARAMP
jgi:hypothetical protein